MYDSSARREQEIKNLSAVYNELKTKILPELRRTQLVASADVVGLSDEEIVAAIQSKDAASDSMRYFTALRLSTTRPRRLPLIGWQPRSTTTWPLTTTWQSL